MTAEIHSLPPPVEPARPELPANVEVEQALLGAVLADNRAYDKAAETGIQPEHFADELHARLWESIGNLINGGKAASVLTLAPAFPDDKKYLAGLYAAPVMQSQTPHYATHIIDLYRRRAAMLRLEDGIAELSVFTGQLEQATEIIDSITADLSEARDAGQGNDDHATLADHVDAWLRTAEAARQCGGVVGVPTGLTALDKALGGLHRGELIVLGGATGQGKSALALTAALNAAEAGKSVMYVSYEMTPHELAGRLTAMRTGISADRQRRGETTDIDAQDLYDARGGIIDLPLDLWMPRMGHIGAIQARARAKKRKGRLDLIVVDYLQLMVGGRAENRTQEVAAITRGLKRLAGALDVPILALAQLSRQVDAREDKRPQLADLRESGSIEQDADIVLFVWQEWIYLKRKGEPKDADKQPAYWAKLNEHKDRAEVVIAKNRHGPCCGVTLRFDGARTLFGDEERV